MELHGASDDSLRSLAALADKELAHLDAATMLGEVLERVATLLRADTVAILTLDVAAGQLVARAAHGLEEEVRAGVRVPLGRGFSGRVAAARAPVILDRVDATTVVSPILWEKGIQSLVGVPLIHAGAVLGVMHAGSLDERTFTDEDAQVLQFAADRVAASLAAEQVLADQSAARTLQRSLLPPRFPDLPGLEFAARFVAAEDFGVGGDWYDTFVLPSGRVGIVIGDVAGSGLQAAVVMGRLRSALRAYAVESNNPADALDRLDRKFAHFEPGEMATVLYAVIEPTFDSLTMATAGHLPPVCALPEAAAQLIDIEASPPIGAHLGGRRHDTIVAFPEGAAIGFYTDGLVERRHEPIDEGLARLCAAFSAGPPDRVCGTVMTALTSDAGVQDDTALLVVRRVG